ncbi:MAG: hypothetical protein IPP91_15700 [Betaproteobacteria bacterium]|nr:hypothetical protein [Betaproteobacteria bacterium]
MKKSLIAALLLTLCGAVGATPQVSGDGACGVRAVDNESFVTCDGGAAPGPVGPDDLATRMEFIAPMPISAMQAWQISQDLGKRVLLVDIRTRAEVFHTGMLLGIDAHAPFMEPLPDDARGRRSALAMDASVRFVERMDDLLSAAHLHHGDPIVLLCRSGERSRLAARLMIEHGYLQVFTVAGGIHGVLTASASEGKRAGLPWTLRNDSGWPLADEPAKAR